MQPISFDRRHCPPGVIRQAVWLLFNGRVGSCAMSPEFTVIEFYALSVSDFLPIAAAADQEPSATPLFRWELCILARFMLLTARLSFLGTGAPFGGLVKFYRERGVHFDRRGRSRGRLRLSPFSHIPTKARRRLFVGYYHQSSNKG
jgi:hypothetical protein